MTEEPTGWEYKRILNDGGRRSYRFAQGFLEAAGIELRLTHSYGATCRQNETNVGFHSQPNHDTHMDFDLKNDPDVLKPSSVSICYTREIGPTGVDMLDSADLHRTIERVVENAGYEFLEGNARNERGIYIGMRTSVLVTDFSNAAEVIGTVDKLIRLYLSEPESTEPEETPQEATVTAGEGN